MTRERFSRHFSFVSGFVQDHDTIRIVAQADALTRAGEPNSSLLKLVLSEDKRYAYDLDWYATSVWAGTVPELQLFALGPHGRVNVGTLEGNHEEEIDGSDSGTQVLGELRDLRYIGNHLYVAGMRRQ